MKAQKLVQRMRDYFSVVDQMDVISHGLAGAQNMEHIIHTNSDHVVMQMLKHTDLCNIGLDVLDMRFKDAEIKKVDIKGGEGCIEVGYISRQLYILSSQDRGFLECLKTLFENKEV